jgi:adenosine deaminase
MPDMMDARVLDFLHKLPKVELHCHLLGTVQRQTLLDWTQRVAYPVSVEEVESFYVRGEKPIGVLRVLRALEQQLLQGPQDLYRLTLEYLQSAASHQVRYAELFWNPTGCARDAGIAYAPAIDAMTQALVDAQAQWGIVGRIIPSIDREASPAEAVQMVQWMIDYRHDEVIGLGMDYRENDRPPEMFVEAYALAGKAGFKRTAHAGEFGMPWHNVRAAIDLLKVDRIDHGYTVIDNPSLVRECIDRDLVFTVVPTNSYYLRTLAPERWALDHPIRQMPRMGLKVHPNTDDPTLHLVTPTQAWFMMVRDFEFSLDDLKGFMLHGLDAAWIDSGQRAVWRRQFSEHFDLHRPIGVA